MTQNTWWAPLGGEDCGVQGEFIGWERCRCVAKLTSLGEGRHRLQDCDNVHSSLWFSPGEGGTARPSSRALAGDQCQRRSV